MAEKLDKDTKKILGALSYPIFIVGIVALAMDKNDKDLRFHAYQGIFFAACMFVIGIAFSIIQAIFASMFFMVWFSWILTMVFSLFWLGMLVVVILYAIKAYNGEKPKIPVVYPIAKMFIKDL